MFMLINVKHKTSLDRLYDIAYNKINPDNVPGAFKKQPED